MNRVPSSCIQTKTARLKSVLATVALATLFLPALPASAQGAPADAVFQGFKPSSEFIISVGGADLKDAEVYLSDKAASYLIIASSLSSPLLINTRTQMVESVSFMKVQKNADRSIDLLADASFDQVDRFQVSGNKVTWKVKGQEASLRPKPPLVGLHTTESLRRNKPDYAFKADEYKVDAALLAKLKAEGRNVKMRVYFGTWCPTCGRMVPKVLKMAENLQGSKVQVEYYGLPQPMSDDPITAKDNLNGVPTAIIYIDGKEFGRLDAHTLGQPESALQKLLAGEKI